MSPVEIALLGVCAVLLLVLAAVTVAMRRLGAGSAALAAAVERLGEQVAELSRRESERLAASGKAQEADWVITFDDEEARRRARTRRSASNGTARGAGNRSATEQQHTVSTQQVVSTAMGEPMIKVAAFSHGVRQALREERRAHLAFQVRREYRRRRKVTRARVRAAQRAAQRTPASPAAASGEAGTAG